MGESRFASSSRSGWFPSQETTQERIFAPCSASATSVSPTQFMTAPTFGVGSVQGPDHLGSSCDPQPLSKPAEAGIIAVVSARCPPAEAPVTTTLLTAKLYFFALRPIQCSAQRQSSNAAGASETFATRYSTFTAAHPISK